MLSTLNTLCIRPLFFIPLAFVFFTNVSIPFASTYDNEDSDKRRNISAALQELTLRAESGDLVAQSTIAALYHETVPSIRDYRKSAKWYRILAEDSGISWASAYVGMMHYLGQGAAWDIKEARRWLYPAAAEGHRMARTLLLHMDEPTTRTEYIATNAKVRRWLTDNIRVRGGLVGIDSDSLDDFDTKADTINTLLPAASEGNVTAQTILGLLYGNRIVIRADSESGKGVHWLRLASKQGSNEAQTLLGSLYSTNRRNMTIKWDLEEAAKWYLMAAEQGDAEGQFFVGAYLWGKKPGETNQSESLKWLVLSALQNNKKAIETLKLREPNIAAKEKEKAYGLVRMWMINRVRQ